MKQIPFTKALKLTKIHLGEYLKNSDSKVKRIYILNNNTIVCEFHPSNKLLVDIKIEIGGISSYLYSALIDFFAANRIKYIAVRAITLQDEELVYAISSLKAVKEYCLGNEIYWLNNTVFQENTEEAKLNIAKHLISQLENSLRKIISHEFSKLEPVDWWNLKINNKIRSKAESAYQNKNNRQSTIGEELIYFTYTLDLKKIICTHWVNFRGILGNKQAFESNMEQLNLIRREEAHNRIISNEDISKLKMLYEEILSKISRILPEIVPQYLIENWRSKVNEIFEIHKIQDAEIKEKDAIGIIKHLVNYIKTANELDQIITKLKSLTPPVGKKSLHEKIVIGISNLKASYDEVISEIKDGKLENIEESCKILIEKSNQLNEVTKQILLEG